jgi:hypothetical protein
MFVAVDIFPVPLAGVRAAWVRMAFKARSISAWDTSGAGVGEAHPVRITIKRMLIKKVNGLISYSC